MISLWMLFSMFMREVNGLLMCSTFRVSRYIQDISKLQHCLIPTSKLSSHLTCYFSPGERKNELDRGHFITSCPRQS
ncbi:hypothetical protein BX600DRAFT_458545 [Xylariales sp. PMI_506]|nr:hypothetical protein BX600DRAFT_458545 [Xylariales sp. PMI_506]